MTPFWDETAPFHSREHFALSGTLKTAPFLGRSNFPFLEQDKTAPFLGQNDAVSVLNLNVAC